MNLMVLLCLGALLTLNTALSLECHKKPDDTFEFRERGEVVEPEEFDCMSVTKPIQTTTIITYMSDDEEGRKICQIHDDGVPKDKKIFTHSEVETGRRCRFSCKDSTGLFKCDSTTTATENACTCEPLPHRILIQPVIHTLIGGQNEQGEEEHSCDGKPEGHQFPDPVPCIAIRADVHKSRVDFIRDEPGMCKVETSSKPETRYAPASPTELNLQGCLSVCKRAGPQCIYEEDDGKCECASPGLKKRLVAMDELSVRDMLMQTNCTRNGCGPCAECNEDTRECVLDPNAHMGLLCRCGEICPEVDIRSPDLRGGKILCKPNTSLECMRRPEWLKTMFDESEAGTRYPNLCTKGNSDRGDTCSCAQGYIEDPEPFSETQDVYCKKE